MTRKILANLETQADNYETYIKEHFPQFYGQARPFSEWPGDLKDAQSQLWRLGYLIQQVRNYLIINGQLEPGEEL